MKKVNLQVMKKSVIPHSNDFRTRIQLMLRDADTVSKRWIASRISELLGNEDDVVIELCFNLIEDRFVSLKCIALVLASQLTR